MTTLNDLASEAALAAGVVAATDVTGFSLLGHLHRMLRASRASAGISAAAVPLLPGARELTRAGHVSGGTRNNIAFLASWAAIAGRVPDEVAILLQDAQTSGGLLLATPSPSALLAELGARDVAATVIGGVTGGPAGHIAVRP
jgi:selenide,water dikinase